MSKKGSNPPPSAVTSRAVARKNITKAFQLWEEEYRRDPDSFMSDTASETVHSLADCRATYFIKLLDKISSPPLAV